MSMASAPDHCFHGSRNLGDLLFEEVDRQVCRLTEDFVDGHGHNNGADGFPDSGFIGRW
jgi:hypothetical protein